jgi:hypothetical protein
LERALADGRLVHHHHALDVLGPSQAVEGAGRLGRLAEVLGQRREQHVLDQRGFARAGHAGDAHQAPQRDRQIDALQVVLARAGEVRRGASAATGRSWRRVSTRLRPAR